MTDAPVFSIVVPTYNRRAVLLQSIRSLVAAERPWPCELIVVDDGSVDGTEEAVAALRLPLPVRVIRQENSGAAAARNRGAAAAAGRYLLFVDDDMTVDRRLLVEHERSLAAGADAVVGDILLHPDSPRTLLSRGVDRWARRRRSRLEREAGRLTVSDFLTGQLSVRRSCFTGIEGFDEALTAGGSFGGEDTDLLFRLRQADVRLHYNGAAISYQRYVVTPEQNLRQWRDAGRTDATLSRKHPALGPVLFTDHRGGTVTGRSARAAAHLPAPALRAVSSLVTRRISAGRMDPVTEWTFARVRDVAYWQGARSGGGIARTGVPAARILAYHAVDRGDDPVTGRWTVDPEVFEQHMTTLLGDGFTFVTADRVLAHLDGGPPLGPRELLLTFDDGYGSLLQHAVPVLTRLGVPAVVCVVTSQLGGHNAWDADRGAAAVPLLDAGQLRQLTDLGWEVASHTHTHRRLTSLPARALREELGRSRAILTGLGLPAPRLLAYPHGDHDFRVRGFTGRAGYRAGLALAGRRPPGAGTDRYALTRLEVLNGMDAEHLSRLLTGPEPAARPERRRALRAVIRSAADGVPGQRSGSTTRDQGATR